MAHVAFAVLGFAVQPLCPPPSPPPPTPHHPTRTEKISGISGSAVNGTRFVGSSHWKIPRKSGKSKKVGPFSRLEFPNGMSCPIYVSRSLYQFQARLGTATYRGLRPNGTTFYQSEIPLLLPSKFPGFFPKWKAPSSSYLGEWRESRARKRASQRPSR